MGLFCGCNLNGDYGWRLFWSQLKELSTDDIVSLAAIIRGYLTDEKTNWIYRERCFILKLI